MKEKTIAYLFGCIIVNILYMVLLSIYWNVLYALSLGIIFILCIGLAYFIFNIEEKEDLE